MLKAPLVLKDKIKVFEDFKNKQNVYKVMFYNMYKHV